MELYFRESGDMSAPLLVFLHGGGVSGWMWDKQTEYFQHYHCLVPDLPGHGRSSGMAFSIAGSAGLLINLIEFKAKNKPVILIGFSLGAQIALQILGMAPYRIEYAMINSALVRPVPLASHVIRPLIRLTHGLTKLRSFSKLQARQLYIGADIFETYYEETCQMKADTLVDILQENMTFQIPGNFHKVETKILVTVGENERSMMRKSAADIENSNSNCRSLIIPHVGHGVSLAQPELFHRIVESFLD
ncbi:alpha/beta fold hydrolase [Paenibacillus lentus]|uniref:Alpha/beta hydrolase n=1 Tax=Paenibacillus lentus TaxID=1338368 RepID=A0A3Q8SCY7_9BACL|nr:alpha/beta hydrolase [Paenibacillus lentus]AZK47894.1 alpha/beta hydrolase [Paenibacillus lentus]